MHDVVIVGAGIVGAACAAACARAGLTVLVLDRGPIGGGTTGAAMGHIVIMDDSEAQFALTAYSRGLWHRLLADLPADVEYERCGTLWAAADDQEMGEVLRKQRFYGDRGVRVEVLDAAALRDAEPNLRRDLVGGLRVIDDGVIYPPAAARHLLARAREQGAAIRTGVAVRSLCPTGGVVLEDGTRIAAGLAVNACGCWSPDLTPGLPVRKRKGHLVITDRYPGFLRHQTIELGYLKSAHAAARESVAFNIQPRRTGQLLIGSSRQFDADDTAVEPRLLSRMLARAIEYVPALGQLSAIRAWTGHRAATPDKLPYIGRSRESDRIRLATGHEGLGVTTLLATAKLLADQIMDRPTDIPAAPYQPARPAAGVPPHG